MSMMTKITPSHDMLAVAEGIALDAGYAPDDLVAARLHGDRAAGRAHPPGEFDRRGRFHADERTEATDGCRRPSTKWPYSEMRAARTAAHCAEVCGSDPLDVRRLAKLLKLAEGLDPSSAHARLAAIEAMTRSLKRKLSRPRGGA